METNCITETEGIAQSSKMVMQVISDLSLVSVANLVIVFTTGNWFTGEQRTPDRNEEAGRLEAAYEECNVFCAVY